MTRKGFVKKVRSLACAVLALAMLLAATLIPTPAMTQMAQAAESDDAQIIITKNPQGGTFAKNNPVRLYISATSTANHLLKYTWYRNTSDATSGGEAVGANSSILSDGSALDAGTYYYYCSISDETAGIVTASTTATVKVVDKGSIGTAVENGDFETVGTPSNNIYYSPANIPPWDTTHYGTNMPAAVKSYSPTWKVLERAHSNSIYKVPNDGHEYVCELGAYVASSIYQEVATVPGAVYSWSIDHCCRGSIDESIAVVIGPAVETVWSETEDTTNFPYGRNMNTLFNAVVEQVATEHSTTVSELPTGAAYTTTYGDYGTYYVYTIKEAEAKTWYTYNSTYTVPEGQGSTVFGFVSTYDVGGFGNLLDNISFQQGEGIDATASVDGKGNGVLSVPASKDGYLYGLLEVRGSTSINVSGFEATTNDGTTLETVSITGASGWYEPGTGGITFNNLTPGKTYRIVEVPKSAVASVQGLNLTPAGVLDSNCYTDYSVAAVASDIGTIQVRAEISEDGQSATLVVDPARDDVEYAVLGTTGSAEEGTLAANPSDVKGVWKSSTTGSVRFPDLALGTTYAVIGRAKGYTEITYVDAADLAVFVSTPSASFRDVTVGDIERAALAEDGYDQIVVTNNGEYTQLFMVYDEKASSAVTTSLPLAEGGWVTLAPGASATFTVDSSTVYHVLSKFDTSSLPGKGVYSYPAPDGFAIDYINERLTPQVPASVRYRMNDNTYPDTYYLGSADTWLRGTGGSYTFVTNYLETMSSTNSAGATFTYSMYPDQGEPAACMESTLTVPARPEPPTCGTAGNHANDDMWVDWAPDDPVLHAGDTAIQVRVQGAKTWTRIEANGTYLLSSLGWVETTGLTFEGRLAATDAAFASEIAAFTEPGRKQGPEGVTGKKVGSSGSQTYTLENVADTMEYRVYGSTDAWTSVPESATTATVTSDNTYEVRYKATDTAPASFIVTASTTDAALTLQATAEQFSSQAWGYHPDEAATSLDIQNAGTARACISSVVLEGDDMACFNLDVSAIELPKLVAAGQGVSLPLKPVADLPPGVYQAKAVVTYQEVDEETSTGTGHAYVAAVSLILRVNRASQFAPSVEVTHVSDTELTAKATLAEDALYDRYTPTKMYLSIDGVTWESVSPDSEGAGTYTYTFTGLTAATGYTVYAYVPLDDNQYTYASDQGTWAGYTAFAAPATSVVTFNYAAETIGFSNVYEVATKTDGTGVSLSTGASIASRLSTSPSTLYVRHVAEVRLDGVIAASEWTAVTVPARPAAPASITATNASASWENDGTITVTGATEFQFRRKGTSAWISASGSTTSGATVGTYEVRYSATNSAFASEISEVDVFLAADGQVYVRFHANDGAFSDSTTTKEVRFTNGTCATAYEETPARAGYSFGGWYTALSFAADGSPVLADAAFDFSVPLTTDVTLYAQWNLILSVTVPTYASVHWNLGGTFGCDLHFRNYSVEDVYIIGAQAYKGTDYNSVLQNLSDTDKANVKVSLSTPTDTEEQGEETKKTILLSIDEATAEYDTSLADTFGRDFKMPAFDSTLSTAGDLSVFYDVTLPTGQEYLPDDAPGYGEPSKTGRLANVCYLVEAASLAPHWIDSEDIYTEESTSG